MSAPRHIAFLAFPRLTLLDLVGPYDVLRRVAAMGIDAGVRHSIVAVGVPHAPGAAAPAPLADDTGFRFLADAAWAPLDDVDLLVVPGGHGTRALEHDARLAAYLLGYPAGRPIASVCTGSLLLGAAGLLRDRRATTHHTAFSELAAYAREVVTDARVVDDGRVITAGGVTAGIDLGLHLVTRFWGAEAAAKIARQMNLPR